MPGFERDQQAIDNTVENRRLGSVMLTAGWIVLWFDAILLVYFFTSIRDGTYFWPIWTAIQGVIGLADCGHALSPDRRTKPFGAVGHGPHPTRATARRAGTAPCGLILARQEFWGSRGWQSQLGGDYAID